METKRDICFSAVAVALSLHDLCMPIYQVELLCELCDFDGTCWELDQTLTSEEHVSCWF